MQHHVIPWLTARGRRHDMPGWVFVVQVLWAIGLLVLFLLVDGSPDRLGLPHAFGRIPLEAPWLGAVGGLLASFSGIVHYAVGKWEPRFNYWHPVKPLLGAATGAVACLLVIVLVHAASASRTATIDAPTLDAAAFIFGFAESAFQQLIKAVTDVFLKPGGTEKRQQAGGGPDTTPPAKPSSSHADATDAANSTS